jgi:transcriptional regulator with XRE-family HTH domain
VEVIVSVESSSSVSVSVSAEADDRSKLSEQRRRELADFLRTRREKIKPEQVGISQMSRRRTPGLRREEVAELAGVGTTWYTWLEQARDIQPSSEVLRRLGQALQMTPAEIRHLFALAGKTAPSDTETYAETVPESLDRIVKQALTVPAIILGRRWDVLDYNHQMLELIPYLAESAPEKRNWLDLVLCAPHIREILNDWEPNARRVIAEFRSSLSDSLEDPWVLEVVNRLKIESAEFNQWWREHDVRDKSVALLDVNSPNGRLVLERSILRTPENPRLRVVLFTPVQR